jgi:hypothetical protein
MELLVEEVEEVPHGVLYPLVALVVVVRVDTEKLNLPEVVRLTLVVVVEVVIRMVVTHNTVEQVGQV